MKDHVAAGGAAHLAHLETIFLWYLVDCVVLSDLSVKPILYLVARVSFLVANASRDPALIELLVGTYGLVQQLNRLLAFIDIKLLEVHHLASLLQAAVPALAALGRFLGVLPRLRHVVLVYELGATVYAVTADEQRVPVLLACRLQESTLFDVLLH